LSHPIQQVERTSVACYPLLRKGPPTALPGHLAFGPLSGEVEHPAGASPSKCYLFIYKQLSEFRSESTAPVFQDITADHFLLAKTSGMSSDFSRRSFVENGVVGRNSSSIAPTEQSGRVWVVSSLKTVSSALAVCVVTFERGFELNEISGSAFRASGLRSIIIPSSIIVLGKWSFCWCRSLEFVIFENGSRLERIEESAFSGSGLSSIVIPLSVVVLGKRSFHYCKSLESVTFEQGSQLERIEEAVFSESGLQSIAIPPRVTFIGASALAGVFLKSISISPDNGTFRFREWFLESLDGSMIYRYFGSCDSIVISSSVVVLSEWSFHYCKLLESVHFESGSRLERIEESAFRESGLTSIVIPSSVAVLGKESFHSCTSLKSVIFEDGSQLERIEELVFSWSGLKSIEIPPRVTSIDASAFAGVSLSSLSVSQGNRTFRVSGWFLEDFVGSTICRYCSSCHSVFVPSSILALGKRSFFCCKLLGSVVFENGSRLERIEESAFRESGLKSIVIPSSVVVLGKSSFCYCWSLESVVFENGSQLERIEESSFHGSRLKSIVIPSSIVVLEKESFSSCKSLESLVFEKNSRLERIEGLVFADSGLKSIEIPPCVAFIDVSAFQGLPFLRRTCHTGTLQNEQLIQESVREFQSIDLPESPQ
jgi:hypothetical protein